MSERFHNVIDLIAHSETIHELVVERGDVSFTVGDCVALFGADGQESRPYSLAGGIHENVLRVLFRHLPGGMVTSHLSQLKAGDVVKMSTPFGWFRPGQDAPESPLTFIATSTGIAPFLAYLRSYPIHPPTQILYGVREAADAVNLDLLTRGARLQVAVSRERVPGHHLGRVTDLLESLTLSDHEQVYLCGLDAMIDEVSDWLEARGVEFRRIHREVFFHAQSSIV